MKTSFLSEGGLWLLSNSIRLQEATIIHMIPQGSMRLRCKVSRSTQTGGTAKGGERGVTQAHTHLCGSPCAKRSHHRLRGSTNCVDEPVISLPSGTSQAEELQAAGSRGLLEGRVEEDAPHLLPSLMDPEILVCGAHLM